MKNCSRARAAFTLQEQRGRGLEHFPREGAGTHVDEENLCKALKKRARIVRLEDISRSSRRLCFRVSSRISCTTRACSCAPGQPVAARVYSESFVSICFDYELAKFDFGLKDLCRGTASPLLFVCKMGEERWQGRGKFADVKTWMKSASAQDAPDMGMSFPQLRPAFSRNTDSPSFVSAAKRRRPRSFQYSLLPPWLRFVKVDSIRVSPASCLD